MQPRDSCFSSVDARKDGVIMRILSIAVVFLAGAVVAAPMLDGDVSISQADDSLVTITYGIKGESAIQTIAAMEAAPAMPLT